MPGLLLEQREREVAAERPVAGGRSAPNIRSSPAQPPDRSAGSARDRRSARTPARRPERRAEPPASSRARSTESSKRDTRSVASSSRPAPVSDTGRPRSTTTGPSGQYVVDASPSTSAAAAAGRTSAPSARFTTRSSSCANAGAAADSEIAAARIPIRSMLLLLRLRKRKVSLRNRKGRRFTDVQAAARGPRRPPAARARSACGTARDACRLERVEQRAHVRLDRVDRRPSAPPRSPRWTPGRSAERQSATSTRRCAARQRRRDRVGRRPRSAWGPADSDGSWKRSRVAPTRITSRWRSVRRPCTRSSLTNVPFVERPSSSTVQTPSIASSDACVRETCASQVSASPDAGERPIGDLLLGQRDQLLHAVAVAQLDERRRRTLRREPLLQLARGGRVTIGPVAARAVTLRTRLRTEP